MKLEIYKTVVFNTRIRWVSRFQRKADGQAISVNYELNLLQVNLVLV